MITKYEEGMLQVASAFRKYVGLDSKYQEDEKVKQWLNDNKFSQVMVFLIDAMGTKIIENNLPEDSFIRSHILENTLTVFPPTTTAATTSLLTGKSPKENGWLGWNQYFKEKDDCIVLFLNKGQYSDVEYPGFAQDTIPTLEIDQELKGKAGTIMPAFAPNGCQTFDEMLERMVAISNDESKKFVYAYWDALDSLMHKVGPSDEQVKVMMLEIDNKLKQMVPKLNKKTGLIILADHGQIDVVNHNLADDSEIMECLEHLPSIEPRTIAFFIKDGMNEKFKERFNKKFAASFTLLSKQEVIDMDLFGKFEAHPRFEEFIGDYVAIATSNVCLSYNGHQFKGQHAGSLPAEMEISIITYPMKGDK